MLYLPLTPLSMHRMCCQISDKLALHLQVGRHSLYSDAQLKCQELSNDFVGTLKVTDRQ